MGLRVAEIPCGPTFLFRMVRMKVRKSEAMPPADFERHMLVRHSEGGEIGTLKAIDGIHQKDRATWETYHERLHKTREYQHEH